MRRRWVRWLVWGAVLAAVLVLVAAWARDRMALSNRRHMLGDIQCLCRLYSMDHRGAMPPDLGVLFPKYLNSPLHAAYVTNDVDYFPGATEDSNPATVLLREKRPDRRGRRWVASVDMSLELTQAAP